MGQTGLKLRPYWFSISHRMICCPHIMINFHGSLIPHCSVLLTFILARCIFQSVIVMNANGIILTEQRPEMQILIPAFAMPIIWSHDRHQVGLTQLISHGMKLQLSSELIMTWPPLLRESQCPRPSLIQSLDDGWAPGGGMARVWWWRELLKSRTHSPTVHWRLVRMRSATAACCLVLVGGYSSRKSLFLILAI